MPIDCKIKLEDGLLYVKTTGRYEQAEQVKATGSAVISKVIEHQSRRILCDERELDYALGTYDIYQSAQSITDLAPKRGLVAIVCKPENLTDAQFFEDVAVNRGLKLRFFTDLHEAKDWLQPKADDRHNS